MVRPLENNLINKLLFFFLLILVVILLAVYGIYRSLSTPYAHQHTANYLEVKKGTNLTQLSLELKEKGIIAHEALFRRYAQLTGKARSIKEGYYVLPEKISPLELLDLLISGKTANVQITLPEGRTSWEYFDILKPELPQLDVVVWDSLVNDEYFAAQCSVHAPTLEGYLYPETYLFPVGSSERDVLFILTGQFFRSIQSIPLDSSEVYRKYGLHGLITLASIVEEEAMVKSEQKIISGVFYNRLTKDWPLGADPTVRFFLKKLTGPLYLSDLRNTSPYNTRLHVGLPPGPISNPGLDAIDAAAFPAETPYMFFVAKDDGSREHFFSETNRQHDRYKVKRRENQKNSR